MIRKMYGLTIGMWTIGIRGIDGQMVKCSMWMYSYSFFPCITLRCAANQIDTSVLIVNKIESAICSYCGTRVIDS